MTARSSNCWLLAIAIVIAATTHALADAKTEAREHLQKATAAHAAGNYEAALKELTAAYSLDPQPDMLFAIGQVYMKLGDCASAVTFYKQFLDTHPAANETAVAQKAIFRCDKFKAAEPTKPVEPANPIEPAKPLEPVAQVKPEPDHPVVMPPASSPWYRDAIGHVLVGGGLISGAVGVVMYRSALRDRDAVDHATSYQATQDLLDRSHRERIYTIAATAAGGALVAVGLVHYIVHGRRPTEQPVAIVPTAGGGVMTWSRRF